jgi:hypothetical protein
MIDPGPAVVFRRDVTNEISSARQARETREVLPTARGVPRLVCSASGTVSELKNAPTSTQKAR